MLCTVAGAFSGGVCVFDHYAAGESSVLAALPDTCIDSNCRRVNNITNFFPQLFSVKADYFEPITATLEVWAGEFNGSFSSTGTLVKADSGSAADSPDNILVLAADLNYNPASVTVAGGTLTSIVNQHITALNVNAGGIMDMQNHNLTVRGGSIDGTLQNVNLLALDGANPLAVNVYTTVTNLNTGSGVLNIGRNTTLTVTGAATLGSGSTLGVSGNQALHAANLTISDNAAVHIISGIRGVIISSDNVIANNGATLGGIGSIGGLTVKSGGILSPGSSIGTITVKGDAVFEAGSGYHFDVGVSGSANEFQSDLLDVMGKVTIKGGSLLHIGLGTTAAHYSPLGTWTIISAANGVDGEFGDWASSYAFIDMQVVYEPNAVKVILTRNDTPFT